MALPRKLKYMNVFGDGENWVGLTEEFTPAKLTRKFEKYRGGGMSGGVDVDMGFDDDALGVEFVLGGYEAQLVKKMGTAKIDGVSLRFAGSFQRDDTGEISAVEIDCRGRYKELDRGTYKQGDNSTTKVSMTNTYYKETVDGTVITEIDIVNNVWTVDGEDLMAEHRQAIGL